MRKTITIKIDYDSATVDDEADLVEELEAAVDSAINIGMISPPSCSAIVDRYEVTIL